MNLSTSTNLIFLYLLLHKQGGASAARHNLKGSDPSSSTREETKGEAIFRRNIDKAFGERRERFTEETNADSFDLPTDGYCWIHEAGKFCFEDDRFQSVSITDDEIFVEEFFDSKKYSYSLQNIQQLHLDYQSFSSANNNSGENRKLVHAMTDSSWLDSLDGIKYGCRVEEDFGSFSVFDANNATELLTANADSSSIWRFQDWVVNVDSDMIPISILTPIDDEDSNEEFPFEFFTSVSAVEPIPSSIVGCDPEKDSKPSPDISVEGHERFLQVIKAHDPSVSEEDYFANYDDVHHHRKLVPSWVTSFTAEISNTQWCGPGTDNGNTPCPDPTKDFDFNADNACRRHDHGAKYVQTSIGLPRLECYVDNQINQAGGHNWAVSAVYGKWGGAGAIGCYNFESYKCWKRQGWRIIYTTCGKKWKTKFGPSRYNGNVKTAGYKAKEKTCPYDYLVPF